MWALIKTNSRRFAHHRRRVFLFSSLVVRDQIHVANTGYDRITFAAIVNSGDACWPTWSSCLFAFLCWSTSISNTEFEYETVKKKYDRQGGFTRTNQSG